MKGYHHYKMCIDACLRCAAICNHCATACTLEENVKMMAACIRLDMECSEICCATAKLMSFGSENAPEICRLCAKICEQCRAECEKHDNEHCHECAQACIECAEKCAAMAA